MFALPLSDNASMLDPAAFLAPIPPEILDAPWALQTWRCAGDHRSVTACAPEDFNPPRSRCGAIMAPVRSQRLPEFRPYWLNDGSGRR